PIAVNEVVGEVVAYLGDQELARVPALAAADVGRANFFVRTWRWIRDAFSGGQQGAGLAHRPFTGQNQLDAGRRRAPRRRLPSAGKRHAVHRPERLRDADAAGWR